MIKKVEDNMMFDSSNIAPRILGIAGGTGSGKTTVANVISRAMPKGTCTLVEHDWYYKDRSDLCMEEREKLNFDEPRALDNLLLIEQLQQLRAGQTIEAPQYDFSTHCRKEKVRVVQSCRLIIVEGILTFSVPALRDIFDLRLFVDTASDIRLMRRIKRDIRERGREIDSIQNQYYSTVRPMHIKHVAPVKEYAHLIIPEGGKNQLAIDVIVSSLRHLLGIV